MISCVCMNPALDKTIELDGFTYGGLNRVQSAITDAAGKAASYNVRINLPGVKDEVFAAECRMRMSKALEEIAGYSAKTAAKMVRTYMPTNKIMPMMARICRKRCIRVLLHN